MYLGQVNDSIKPKVKPTISYPETKE